MTPADGDAVTDQAWWSLRRRLTVGLFGYIIVLTLGILANDFVVNESAEHLAWEALLNVELDHFLERREDDPGYRWPDTETLALITIDRHRQPDHPLLRLAPGVHDEIMIGDRERVILARDVGDERVVIALDISDLESREARLRVIIFSSALVVALLLGCVAAWGAGRLLRPLTSLSDRIGALDPAAAGQQVELPHGASSELALITRSVNHYIARNTAFIEREQAFVGVASYELRTPITVIAGAARLALDEPDVSPTLRKRLLRIKDTADDVNELVTLLLALAKDPAALAMSVETVSLDILLPQIVNDHLHLAQGKQVRIVVADLPASTVAAPLQLVRSAIGNLLRNAIENTRHGDIRLSLTPEGDVLIEDHGPGMSPDQLSVLYTRLAQGEGLDGGGIGLQLIARLCEHLGWSLSIQSDPGHGTRAVLGLRR